MNLFTLNEIKISYSHKNDPKLLPSAKSSTDLYRLLLPDWDDVDYTETFKVVFLSRAMKVLGVRNLSKGGTAGTVVDIKCIFQAALKANSDNIVVAHNHPSGNLQASAEDLKLTAKIKQAGDIMNIKLTDHLIVTSFGYLSFADDGLL
jgi:DNA repair protein RadC